MEKLCKIRDVQRAVNGFESQFEKLYGIGLNEGMALCSLHKAATLSSGELGELLGLTSSNISKVIASLEKKELIRREMGTKDRRQMFFLLSEKGKSLITSINCDTIQIPQALEHFLL